MKAILQSNNLSKSVVKDGVILGVKLMEVNRTARFKGADGKPKTIEITPELIAGLLAHAGNRSIPSHFSHDHFKSENDSIHARLGCVKNIKVDESGNLVGDIHTMSNRAGQDAIWMALNDPDNAAMSAIFEYNPINRDGKTYAHPLSFDAVDLVAEGAACSALFSKSEEESMTKDETISLIKENAASKQDVTEAITAALAKFNPAVTAKDIEDKITAALANHKPTMSEDEKKSVALLAKAELVEQVGKLGPVAVFGNGPAGEDEFEKAVTAQLSAGAKDRVTAVMRLRKDKPDIYNKAVESGKI